MPRKVTQHIVPNPDNQDKDYKNPHSAAVAKYNAKNYNTFSVNLKHNEYEKLILVSGRCGTAKSRILIELLNRLSENGRSKARRCLKHLFYSYRVMLPSVIFQLRAFHLKSVLIFRFNGYEFLSRYAISCVENISRPVFPNKLVYYPVGFETLGKRT